MINIDQIRVNVSESDQKNKLVKKAARLLGIRESDIRELKILKRSIDARKKPEVFYLYSIGVKAPREDYLLKRASGKPNIKKLIEVTYELPAMENSFIKPPVVCGFGPAGMFAAYVLALAGAMPIVIERGKRVEERIRDVERFFSTGELDTESNVQFGEGGAGTFSDGKLATTKNDKRGRNRFVLETLYRFGADGDILTDAKPHIGTDRLSQITANIRQEIERLGGEVRFGCCMEELITVKGSLSGIRIKDGSTIDTDTLVLATGHSARDTFEMLNKKGLVMKAKPFAVGFRVEHDQDYISRLLYGEKAALKLPPASYKVVSRDSAPKIYSFCMCPGGYVINSSSEEGRLCVNGMSRSDRGSGNANSALVMPVGGESFDQNDPLSGMRFQRALEEKAYSTMNGKIPQQLFGDYVENRASSGYGRFYSMTRGQSGLCNLRGLFDDEWERDFIRAVRSLDQVMKGFVDEEMILSGVESRTSSPVRIERDESFMGSVGGVYPCGEGAGYAGGITSAAMDGMKVAEAVLKS